MNNPDRIWLVYDGDTTYWHDYKYPTTETREADTEEYIKKSTSDGEITELKAQVNELRKSLTLIAKISGATTESYRATAELALIGTKTQCLESHNAAIEEEIIQYCIKWKCENPGRPLCDIPRKYQETCEHGKVVNDYCEPCGRVNGGG